MSTKKTGAIGEQIVVQYLRDTNSFKSVELSDNPLDMHRDIVAITPEDIVMKVEVKTRTVIRKYYGVALEKNQWYKADCSDALYFVTNPTDLQEKISVYLAGPNDYMKLESFGPGGQPCRIYDLGKMKLVHVIDDSTLIAEMHSNSVSKYKQ